MTSFLMIAVLMTLAALAFILPPLVKKQEQAGGAGRDEVNLMVLRDQMGELDADLAAGRIAPAEHAVARRDLELRVLDDVRPVTQLAAAPPQRRVAIAVGLAVPLLAGALYTLVGTPNGLNPAWREAAPDQSHDVSQEQLGNMVDGLARKLQAKPDDVEGWTTLAHSYETLGRFGDASKAYAHLIDKMPDSAELLADYADALGMAQGKTLKGEPEKLIARALALDPKHLKALSLAGSAAFEQKDYALAITQWQKVVALVPPDSEQARNAASGIAEASSLSGKPVPAMPAPAAAAPISAAANAPGAVALAPLKGSVELDPALRAGLADTDTVFIFARAAQGARFPLAAMRVQVKDLPAQFMLDDSTSVMSDAKLSSVPMVVVGARISKSGSATPASGDLEGFSAPVSNSSQGVVVRIAARCP